ncbi:Rieske 2Fe-2S domain-containing protein [Rhodococcus sovatensis]|uniref:Rieske-type oxygenase n=1 Tax=Rhodococcus sovatensis TaxID=1805840 RepID=A0ABZ2PHT7_9NOCA
MKPTGWFQIGWSADLEVGAVTPLRYFGQDLVAYRAASGRLVVLSAYCEHLGANMAYGGAVQGEDIECPFHNWRWSPEGRNTCIPYQKATNRIRKVGTWPAAERDGVMYIWHDEEGGPPQYEIPSVFELFEASGPQGGYHGLIPGGTYETAEIRIHPQYVIENGVDFAHFKYVHRTDEIPTVTKSEFDDHAYRTELALTFKRRSGDASEIVQGGTLGSILGLGLAYSYSWGIGGICSLTAVTPVDDEKSILRFSAWASIEDDDDAMLAKRLRSAISQVRADIAIWEHQRYTEPPGLATAEAAGFREVRQWSRRFYPEGHKGRSWEDQQAGTDALEKAELSK